MDAPHEALERDRSMRELILNLPGSKSLMARYSAVMAASWKMRRLTVRVAR